MADKTTTEPSDQNFELRAIDDWAKVELFRWQYGQLPEPNDTRRLDESAGIEAMAKAIEEGLEKKDYESMPAPFNVIEVLRYCARKLRG